MELTEAQQAALRWLYNRGGSGIFNKHGVLLASGELAGVMRMTWNALRDVGYIEREQSGKRWRITETGEQYCRAHPGIQEADSVYNEDGSEEPSL